MLRYVEHSISFPFSGALSALVIEGPRAGCCCGAARSGRGERIKDPKS